MSFADVFWPKRTDAAQGTVTSAGQAPDFISLLPAATRDAMLADTNYAKNLSNERPSDNGYQRYGENNAFDGEILAGGGEPDGGMLPWLTRMGTKRIYQEGEFDNTDRWAPGAKEAALANATYDPKFGLLYDGNDVQKYWIPEKTSFMDKLIPGLIIGAATGGMGSAAGAAIGASAGVGAQTGAMIGRAVAAGANTAIRGGSFSDVLTSAIASPVGQYAGSGISSALKSTIGAAAANVAGNAVGSGIVGGIRAAAGGGSFSDVLSTALWSAGTAGLSTAAGNSVAAATESPTAGKVVGAVTGGLLSSLKPTAQPKPITAALPQAETTGTKKPVSIADLNWNWLSPRTRRT